MFHLKARVTFVITFGFVHLHNCYSQSMSNLLEGGNNTIADKSIRSKRSNFCLLQEELIKGQVEFRDSLRGLELSIFFTKHDNKNGVNLFLTEEGTIPKEKPGIMIKVLDELANRAGFTWRDSFGYKSLEGDQSYTDLLLWAIEEYDIAADDWNESNLRKANGACYLHPWYDDSMTLVAKSRKKKDFGSFLRPFKPMVWVAIGFAIVGTGLLYTLLGKLDKRNDSRKPDTSASIFLSAISFTGHFEFRVRTGRACFFILLRSSLLKTYYIRDN